MSEPQPTVLLYEQEVAARVAARGLIGEMA